MSELPDLYRLYLIRPIKKDGEAPKTSNGSFVHGFTDAKVLRNITKEEAERQMKERGDQEAYLELESPEKVSRMTRPDWRDNWVKEVEQQFGITDFDERHYK